MGSDVTSRLAENLSVLERRSPGLARAIAATADGAVELRAASDASPMLVVAGVPLQNIHAPVTEARRWVTEQLAQPGLAEAECLLVLGFGAGYHLEALATGCSKRIVVIEPSLEVLRAALRARDMTDVLQRVEVRREAPQDAELGPLGQVAVLPFVPALASDREGFLKIRRAVQGRLGLGQLRLKILVVSAMHGGTLPMSTYAARALADLGHAVSLLDLSPFDAGFRHIGAFGTTGARRQTLEARFVDFLAEGVLRRVEYEQPDLVLAMAQAPLTAGLLDRLAADGVKTALWFVEDFRRFPYWQDVGPHYHHVFCIQRDECLAALSASGIANVHYLPCAADPAIHAPVQLSAAEQAAFGSAVSFVGAGYRNRRVTFRRLLDFDLKVWGSDWEGAEGLWDRVVQRDGARISTTDAVRIFNASAINLNLHSSTYVDGIDPLGDFVNPRTFELAACGSFQLVDERRYLRELFVPGVELVTFGSVADLREQIEYYLEHPTERVAMAAASRRRVLAEHTYTARMSDMLEEIFARDYHAFLTPRARTHGTSALVEAAGPDSALGRYLQTTCAGLPDVTLDDLALRIRCGEGPLSEAEEILLFLKQYDDMFLRAYRP